MESTLLFIIAICAIAALGFILTLLVMLSVKNDKIKEQQLSLDKLMRSFNELDEQAKLIVRTDLELNKAQEELDKRLNGINALVRTSKKISQALNENEVFQKLSQDLFEELGFSMCLIATLDDDKQFKRRCHFGLTEEKSNLLLSRLNIEDNVRKAIDERHTFSSITIVRGLKEKVVSVFEAEHFIVSPIISQNNAIGFVFVGNRYNAPPVTQGDEELQSILAGQIGQSIENAHLFEKVFRSSQELEVKVKDRTKELATALQQVEQISRKKSDFISAVSHELRTPLTSIKGYAAILMAGKIGEIPDAVKDRLSKINIHSDNLVSLINNLLDIARIESGRVEMKFAPHNVKSMLENVADLLAPQIKDKELSLLVNVPSEISDVYIDISHAERVLINLLNNAVKFTPKKGTITVAVSPILERGYVVFHVMDTGIGIAPDDLSKLFDEFYRVENEINQNVKGTGLGLALAKNIVEAHRGHMSVKSQVGTGTTFTFTLPATQSAYEERKLEKEAKQTHA